MARPAHRYSVFSQSLDRAAFLAYFLGAVVPFAALGFVAHQFVLPATPDGSWRIALVALIVSIGALSAAAFLLLRRVTRTTLEQIRGDNDRLQILLETSETLARAPHEREAWATAVACALRLAGARASGLLASASDAPAKLVAAAGETALLDPLAEPVRALARRAAADGRPALLTGRRSDESAAAVPVEGVGTLLVAAPGSRSLGTAELGLLATLAALASVAGRRAQLADAQRNFFVHVTDILVAALDAHLDLQAGHSRRVAELANRLGRELGLGEERRQRLHFAALLHDVGMLRIHPQRFPDPKAYRQHPALGHRMLAPIQLWEEVAPLVLHHHEWFDGSGYPEGLGGEDIPLESRIIALAEAFDSMTSASSYKTPVDAEEAIRRIEDGRGTQFDPQVVQAFLALRQGENG